MRNSHDKAGYGWVMFPQIGDQISNPTEGLTLLVNDSLVQ
jgi:hypothetical protein